MTYSLPDYEYSEYGSINEEFNEYMVGFYDDETASEYFIDIEY